MDLYIRRVLSLYPSPRSLVLRHESSTNWFGNRVCVVGTEICYPRYCPLINLAGVPYGGMSPLRMVFLSYALPTKVPTRESKRCPSTSTHITSVFYSRRCIYGSYTDGVHIYQAGGTSDEREASIDLSTHYFKIPCLFIPDSAYLHASGDRTISILRIPCLIQLGLCSTWRCISLFQLHQTFRKRWTLFGSSVLRVSTLITSASCRIPTIQLHLSLDRNWTPFLRRLLCTCRHAHFHSFIRPALSISNPGAISLLESSASGEVPKIFFSFSTFLWRLLSTWRRRHLRLDLFWNSIRSYTTLQPAEQDFDLYLNLYLSGNQSLSHHLSWSAWWRGFLPFARSLLEELPPIHGLWFRRWQRVKRTLNSSTETRHVSIPDRSHRGGASYFPPISERWFLPELSSVVVGCGLAEREVGIRRRVDSRSEEWRRDTGGGER